MRGKLLTRVFFTAVFSILLAVLFFAIPTNAMTDDGKIVVVLDPGHGGKDPGAVDTSGTVKEAEKNLYLAEQLKQILEGTGKFKVYLTRTDNTSACLNRQERAEIADNYNADFFLSVHFNSGGTNTTVNGSQVLASVKDKYYKAELCTAILNQLNTSVGLKNNGVVRLAESTGTPYYWSDELNWEVPNDSSVGPRTDYYGIMVWCSRYGIPSVIVEHCYITNASDLALMKSDTELTKMAQADADALISYFCGHQHTFTATKETDYPTSCVYGGKESYHCTVCGARKDVTAISDTPDPEKHIWYLTASKDSTCSTEGYKTYTCACSSVLRTAYSSSNIQPQKTLAQHTKTETIAKKEHTYEIISQTAPGHAKNGSITRRCTVCQDTYTETIPMTEDHTFAELSRTNATCVSDGKIVYKCSVCTQEKTEILSKNENAHTYSVLSDVAVSCETNGVKVEKCLYCNKTFTTETPAVGHQLKEIEYREPTCTTAGVDVLKCSVCTKEITITFDPTGHEWTEIAGETVCKNCSVKKSETENTSQNEPEGTKENETSSVAETPKKTNIDWTMIVVCLLWGILLIGVPVIVVVLHRKKKKTVRKSEDETYE